MQVNLLISLIMTLSFSAYSFPDMETLPYNESAPSEDFVRLPGWQPLVFVTPDGVQNEFMDRYLSRDMKEDIISQKFVSLQISDLFIYRPGIKFEDDTEVIPFIVSVRWQRETDEILTFDFGGEVRKVNTYDLKLEVKSSFAYELSERIYMENNQILLGIGGGSLFDLHFLVPTLEKYFTDVETFQTLSSLVRNNQP